MDDAELNLVETFEEAEEFVRWLDQRRSVLAVDTETGGLEWWKQPLRVVQVGDARTGWAIPWVRWGGLMEETLRRYDGPMVLHNAKFDVHFLNRNGVQLPWEHVHDTRVLAHLLAPDQSTGLKPLSGRLVHPRATSGQQDLKMGMQRNGWSWATVPVDYEPYWQYAALDAILTARVFERLKKEPVNRELYELEIACQRVCYEMEERGFMVDTDYATRSLDDHRYRGMELRSQLKEEFGIDNPGSNPQVIDFLRNEGVELTKRTEKGNLALDEEVLTSVGHPAAKLILEMRKAEKLANTYFENLIELQDEGLVHPDINTMGARTGRMSVTRPALQTLPRGPVVRDAFVPREGHRLVLIDYEQMELRLFAHYAQESSMIDAINNGVDLHSFVCRQIFGISEDEEPPKDKRQVTKNANFAKIYGAGVNQFARTAGISSGDAASFLASYEEAFPMVAKFQEDLVSTTQRRVPPHIFTWAGRYQPMEADKVYKGVNYLIQGGCADLLKRKIVDLDLAGLGEYLVLPVHDEMVFDVPEDDVEEVVKEASEVMTETELFDVPLDVEAKVVDRWGDAYR